jgi:hypothetical protein
MPSLKGWFIDSKSLIDNWCGQKRIESLVAGSSKQRAPRVPILYTKEIRIKFKENIIV